MPFMRTIRFWFWSFLLIRIGFSQAHFPILIGKFSCSLEINFGFCFQCRILFPRVKIRGIDGKPWKRHPSLAAFTSEDFEKLHHVVDFFSMMTYDYSGPDGVFNAPVNWIEQCVSDVDPKSSLGLHFYRGLALPRTSYNLQVISASRGIECDTFISHTLLYKNRQAGLSRKIPCAVVLSAAKSA